MSLNNFEKLTQKIGTRQLCIGSMVALADPQISEIVGEVGYDFCWIEMEHSTLSPQSVLGHVIALRGTGTAPWIRVPWNDPVVIKPVLEMEPAAIVVPMVRNAKEAAAAVAACRYPPHGVRSFGPSRGIRYGGGNSMEYIAANQQQPLVIVQTEHIDAVNDIEAILATPGLTGVCLGPNDLAGSMGKLGQTSDPAVREAVDRIITATKQSGKLVGTAIAYSPEAVDYWMKKDLGFLAVGVDWHNLYAHASMIIKDVRQRKGPTS
jgi:2-dehydro-3-deoxyglucarate aldolase/4-hydroxy-2-oxoheptanedioate aldolase